MGGRTVNHTWADDQGAGQPNLAPAQNLVNSDHALAVHEFTPSQQGSATWLNQNSGADFVTGVIELPSPRHDVFLKAMAEYAPEQQPASNEIALSG